LAVLGFALAVTNVDAAPKNNRQEEQRETAHVKRAQQQVRQAQDKLSDAGRVMRQAETLVAHAQTSQKQTMQRAKQLRDELIGKHESSSGVIAARDAHQAAKSELDRLSAPLVARLREQSAYKAAAQAAEAAQARLRTVADDNRLTADQRAALAKQLSQTSLEPGRMERAAVDADLAARRAREKVESATEAVAAAVDKLQQHIERDPQWLTALAELKQAAAENEAAEAQLRAAQQQTSRAVELLDTEQAQLKQLIARQRIDDKRDRRRAGDKGKSADNKKQSLRK
jgi:hypothetical protein